MLHHRSSISKRTEKILNMAQKDNEKLLFLPKYETTKGLEKCHQDQLLKVISLQSCSKGMLTDDFKGQEEICLQRPNKQQHLRKEDTYKLDISMEKNDYFQTYNQEQHINATSHQSRSQDVLMNVYKFDDKEEMYVERLNKQQDIGKKDTYELDISMEKNDNFKKYESTKYLETYNQGHPFSATSYQSRSQNVLMNVYEFDDQKEICVERPNKQNTGKNDTYELDISLEKTDNLQTYNQEQHINATSHQSRIQDVLINVYEFDDKEERLIKQQDIDIGKKDTFELDIAEKKKSNLKINYAGSSEDIELSEGKQNKQDINYVAGDEEIILEKYNKYCNKDNNNCSKNKQVEGNNIIILQNHQIKPPQYQNSEDILGVYSQVKKVSLRQNIQETNDDTYEEMEEPFQSSGSEYLPSSDEEEDDLSFTLKKNSNMKGKKIKQNETKTKFNEISLDTKTAIPNQKTSPLANLSKNVDRFIVNFGKTIESPPPNIESHLCQSQNKKTTCPYCLQDITHFSRHLVRNHKDEGAVQEFLSLPPNDPKRKILLDTMRRQGNFANSLTTKNIRPVRRPKETEKMNISYIACPDCMGFFRRKYLRRHRKRCSSRSECNISKRENHLSLAQVATVCSGVHGNFLSNLRLKQDVFPIMRNDEISNIAMNDMLICSYAESLLRKHKRTQIRNVISNKMRELGRFVISLRNTTGIQLLFDILKPQFFDNIIGAVRVISGYCEETKTFKAGSLALHMGTTLKQVCDIAIKNIIMKSPIVSCANSEQSLKDLKRLKSLIENHWSSEISSLALKDLKENNYASPKLLPLTQDVIKFQSFVMKEANEASNALKKNIHIKLNYRKLSECVLSLTLLLNRKRIGEIQYLKIETYNAKVNENQQSEFLDCLSKAEQTLCKTFKRVVTGGKGTRPVAILFPPDIQQFIEVLISFRNDCMPQTNPYLFGNPNTDGWLSGYHIVKKMAEAAGVTDTSLFTSTRLRKQIATVLQAINVKDDEMEQFATFMGHTKNTHQTYYRLPQDVFQTAKVSKLLIAINKGKAGDYKGKSIDEITLSDNEFLDETEAEEPFIYDQIDNSVNTANETEMEIEPEEVNSSDKKEMKMKKNRGIRGSWTSEQKKILKAAFQDHIKNKRAPRKQETELFMKKHGDLYKDKSWVTVKAFIYNSYRDI